MDYSMRSAPMPGFSSRSMARYINRALVPKKKGVPQGAPTSCSLATLSLRHLEHLNLICYADDVLYFPSSGDCNPLKDLSLPGFGLIVNPDKSRWIKRNGIWLVPSFKFLGIRYFPGLDRSLHNMEARKAYLLFIALDIAIGYPILTIGYTAWELYYRRQKVFSHFEADTRNGAKLAFTDKESFLSYLSIARELLLNSKYLQGR